MNKSEHAIIRPEIISVDTHNRFSNRGNDNDEFSMLDKNVDATDNDKIPFSFMCMSAGIIMAGMVLFAVVGMGALFFVIPTIVGAVKA